MKVIEYVFILVSIGMLIGAFLLYRNTSLFVAEALRTEGTVVALARSRSSDSTTYRPVVHFTNQQGEIIEFISLTSSNPPSYSKGQQIEVLYYQNEPQKARINDFFSLWGASVFLGGLGAVFFLLGTGIAMAGILRDRKDDAPEAVKELKNQPFFCL